MSEETIKSEETRRAKKLYAALRASEKIEDAWESWRDYRRQITDYIIENSGQGTSLAIFGAGRCNDLDLNRLLNHFSQVILLDRNEEAMREAAGNVKKSQRSRLKIFSMDFVGICSKDYIALAEAFLFGKDVFAAADRLSQIYAKSHSYIEELLKKASPLGTYDYTAALGVHSQLGNVPAWLFNAARTEWKAGKQNARQAARELLEKMERESAFLSVKFNDLILSATKQKAFIGCEKSRAVCEKDEWYALPDSAVSGAWQAIEDIGQRACCGRIGFANYLDIIWPFSFTQKKAYRMMVMEVEVFT